VKPFLGLILGLMPQFGCQNSYWFITCNCVAGT